MSSSDKRADSGHRDVSGQNVPERWSPLHIRLMLHYYAIDALYPCPSPAATDYTRELLDLGLIRINQGSGSGYDATPFGKTFVSALLRTALPTENALIHHRPICEVGTCMKPTVRIWNLYKKPVAVCEEHWEKGTE